MPVESPNSEYDARIAQWQRCRDAVEGEDAIKARTTEYLPMLDNQDTGQYNAYRTRAMFYGASGRTVEGLTGAIFRKPPSIDFPERKQEWIEAVSEDGLSLEMFAKKVVRNVLTTGRHGALLDMQAGESAIPKPYLVSYKSEEIINWQSELIDGRQVSTMVVLEETYQEQKYDDPFVVEDKTRFRVLRLLDKGTVLSQASALSVDDSEISLEEAANLSEEQLQSWMVFGTPNFDGIPNNVYIQEEWQRIESMAANRSEGGDYALTRVIVPKLRGRTFDFIPFVFFGATDLTPDTERPPLLPIVDVNLSHYRNSADLEHGRHYTALPTAWAAGFTVRAGDRLTIGSATAWVSDDPSARVGYLEFTGAGLNHLQTGMEQKEALMAILGARMLEEPKKAVEAADTHKVRRSGEESSLASIAGTIEQGLSMLLKWAANWLGVLDDSIAIELNKDFVAKTIEPQMLTALVSLLQTGRISYDTFFYNLERGELLPEGRTMEEELDLILNSPPIPVEKGMDLDDEEEDEDVEEDEEDEGEEEDEEDDQAA